MGCSGRPLASQNLLESCVRGYYPYFVAVQNAKTGPTPPGTTRRTTACSVGGLGGVRIGSNLGLSWALTGACGSLRPVTGPLTGPVSGPRPATASVRHGPRRRYGTDRRQDFRTMISPEAWSNQASTFAPPPPKAAGGHGEASEDKSGASVRRLSGRFRLAGLGRSGCQDAAGIGQSGRAEGLSPLLIFPATIRPCHSTSTSSA